jgi:cysteinyl-tRNA synthetase
VSNSIDDIIDLIDRIYNNGFAYQSNNDVYFDSEKYYSNNGYSFKPIQDDVITRIENHYKKSDKDFLLWKSVDKTEFGYDTKYGYGRPGWSIECSAMSMKLLGETFDIHGGGIDLQFPHHQNEIAQSTTATGKAYVNYWIHNNFINTNNMKISKSTGATYLKDLIETWNGETIRLLILTSHYRSEINLSDDSLIQANKTLTKFYRVLDEYVIEDVEIDLSLFETYMDNDFNTPIVISYLHELYLKIINNEDRNINLRLFKTIANKIGLLLQNPKDYLGRNDEYVITLIERRNEAKRNKDYQLADSIRNELKSLNISVNDLKDDTTLFNKTI